MNSPFQSFDNDQAVEDAVVEHMVEEPVFEALTSIEGTAFLSLVSLKTNRLISSLGFRGF